MYTDNVLAFFTCDCHFITTAMTRTVIEDTYTLVHLPGKDGAPPIPPRTYSKRTPSTNGHVVGTGGLYNNFVRPSTRKYCLEEFTFVKLLGKGSFGKVREHITII